MVIIKSGKCRKENGQWVKRCFQTFFHATVTVEQDLFCLKRPLQLIKQESYGLFFWSYWWLFFTEKELVKKELVVLKGEILELCETSWIFKFCWNINDLLPISNICFKTMIKLPPAQAGKRTVAGNRNAEFKY